MAGDRIIGRAPARAKRASRAPQAKMIEDAAPVGSSVLFRKVLAVARRKGMSRAGIIGGRRAFRGFFQSELAQPKVDFVLGGHLGRLVPGSAAASALDALAQDFCIPAVAVDGPGSAAARGAVQ